MKHAITAFMTVSKRFEVEADTLGEALDILTHENEEEGVDFTGGWVTVELSPDSTGQTETIAEYFKH